MTDVTHDAPAATQIEPVSQQKAMADTPLRKFFEAAVKFEASDLLLRGGQVPRLRIRGALQPLKTDSLEEQEFEQWIESALRGPRWRRYAADGSIDIGEDFALADGTSHRFRINVFRTRGRSAIAARRVNNTILGFKDLLLPDVLEKISELRQGLILLCGITGCGKSTTIASMLQHINETRPCHIVTIEDPIEYLFTDDKAVVNQREVGIDVPDFPTAMRALVRENPDVVLIGEMRDKETFETALQAAETGHLVFGTIHASSAPQAFGRIYDLFPADERDAIRNMLAYQMQAFVYQKLLPTIRDDIALVPAVEILLHGPSTRKHILEGKEHALDEVIKGDREGGMQTFTDSLVWLVEKEYVHPRVAQANALSPEEVKMRLRGITTRT
jgi:twitching motility protein PilT